jgi:hypothetical protein
VLRQLSIKALLENLLLWQNRRDGKVKRLDGMHLALVGQGRSLRNVVEDLPDSIKID